MRERRKERKKKKMKEGGGTKWGGNERKWRGYVGAGEKKGRKKKEKKMWYEGILGIVKKKYIYIKK